MSFSAKADMDNYCEVSNDADFYNYIYSDYIKENCERNNILIAHGIDYSYQPRVIAEYCRYDRNVVRSEDIFSCVLYDRRPRTNKR